MGPIDVDADDKNADWLRKNAWRKWPADLDAMRAWVLEQGWTIEEFKRLPMFRWALEHRPELRDL